MHPNTGVASSEQVGSLSRAPKALATSDSETKSGSKGEENLPHLQLPRRVRSTSSALSVICSRCETCAKNYLMVTLSRSSLTFECRERKVEYSLGKYWVSVLRKIGSILVTDTVTFGFTMSI